ncbi:hypothetical protein A2Z33_05580 [Candidatus Gottesmanbacteria bacterium RBG_16_52_11]|uniref:Glycosyltransferase 2-like domain-containing protein n=1 Tax=Candidatus Gottesmanbacteria bacterium RBG_16_52_11 TaxID=1798374 RepID=A0A1F5YP81_9BACT|nr:MAG: hypothetical protein A2Z33_05580 [Candidatus Gottesmanbacteria bacterium RBG_16_52_11]
MTRSSADIPGTKTGRPLVTVGMPLYNNAAHIRQSLESLLAQSYKPIEIIISDDGSDDRTFEICRKLARNNPEIRLFQNRHRTGIRTNFNTVLRRAQGKYFTWAAGDDLRHQRAIEKLTSLLERYPDAVLAISGWQQFNDRIQHVFRLPDRVRFEKAEALELLMRHPEYIAGMFYGLYRTEVLRSCGGLYSDRRIHFEGTSDTMTVFRVLLRGDLVHTSGIYFSKKDTGLYLERHTVLSSPERLRTAFPKIIRYMTNPLLFLADCLSSLKLTFSSQMPLHDKLRISHATVLRLFRQSGHFFGEIFRTFRTGIAAFLRRG